MSHAQPSGSLGFGGAFTWAGCFVLGVVTAYGAMSLQPNGDATAVQANLVTEHRPSSPSVAQAPELSPDAAPRIPSQPSPIDDTTRAAMHRAMTPPVESETAVFLPAPPVIDQAYITAMNSRADALRAQAENEFSADHAQIPLPDLDHIPTPPSIAPEPSSEK